LTFSLSHEVQRGAFDRCSLATELFGEAHGYAIERVYANGRLIGVRLLESTQPIRRPSQRRWRRFSR